MTHHDLLRKLNETPFQPFRIRMSNASAIDVLQPGSVIVGESSAVVPTETVLDDRGYRVAREWKTIPIQHIVEFVDIRGNEPHRRKRAN